MYFLEDHFSQLAVIEGNIKGREKILQKELVISNGVCVRIYMWLCSEACFKANCLTLGTFLYTYKGC